MTGNQPLFEITETSLTPWKSATASHSRPAISHPTSNGNELLSFTFR